MHPVKSLKTLDEVFNAKQTPSLHLILKMILGKPEMLQTHSDYMMSENL